MSVRSSQAKEYHKTVQKAIFLTEMGRLKEASLALSGGSDSQEYLTRLTAMDDFQALKQLKELAKRR